MDLHNSNESLALNKTTRVKKHEDREIKRKPPSQNTVEPVLSSHP